MAGDLYIENPEQKTFLQQLKEVRDHMDTTRHRVPPPSALDYLRCRDMVEELIVNYGHFRYHDEVVNHSTRELSGEHGLLLLSPNDSHATGSSPAG
jgi:hypothetical protein